MELPVPSLTHLAPPPYPLVFFFCSHLFALYLQSERLEQASEIVTKKGCSVFIVFLTIKTSPQNILITRLKISLKPHNSRIRRTDPHFIPDIFIIFLACYISVMIVILNLT